VENFLARILALSESGLWMKKKKEK
jgi:hypothetical protein